MGRFYILMLVLLLIAIINLVRALKEKKSKGKFWGVAINVVAIVLLVVAVVVIGVVYAIEQAFTTNALMALGAALVASVAFGIYQTKRHNRLLKDIESGLKELNEFGK